jgi:EpsD family peptidyl-prolyl cis-trans isomerase
MSYSERRRTGALSICFVGIAVILTVSGCGKGDGSAQSLAAKVNGDEISVQQLDAVLARNGSLPPEQLKKAAPQALESMIEQQVLVQKALEGKLDRDPQIAVALENARKQILAQAYMDKSLSGIAKPTAAEIQDFYEKNPALFAQRRVYRFQELGAAIPDEKFDDIKRFAEKAKFIGEIGGWLKERNIQFKAMDSTKAAEELPLDLLPEVSKLNDGQIAVLRGPGRVAVLQLVQSRQAPLDLKQATAYIEQYLLNRKRMDSAKVEVKKLIDSAKIEYVGEFAVAKAAASPGTKAPAAGK